MLICSVPVKVLAADKLETFFTEKSAICLLVMLTEEEFCNPAICSVPVNAEALGKFATLEPVLEIC